MTEDRVLTEEEIEESVRFADGALAAAGHVVDSDESDADVRCVLRGEMTLEEADRRAAARARQ